MRNMLNIVHKLGYKYVFRGLSTTAIRFIREMGLWMPLTNDILAIPEDLSTGNGQIYIDSPNHDDYLTFILEHNEFLTGAVYNHVDTDAIHVDGYLHQYAMEDGSLTFEILQDIHNGLLFLALADANGDVYIGWEDEEIEEVIKLQQ